MKRHARASSAGSTEDRASRPGRLLRGALAIGGGSLRDKGTAAPSGRRTRRLFGAALALAALIALGAATAIADTAPTPTTEAASAVGFTTVHVTGHVNPNGGPSAALWHFQYREASAPEEEGSWVQPNADQEITPPASEESNPVKVEDNLAGLKPSTAYLVRLVASNEGGADTSISAAPFLSFTTKAVAKPVVSVDPVTTFSATSADFSGAVTAGGTDPAFNANCEFNYVTEKQFLINGFESASGVGCNVNPVEGTASTPVHAEATGLEPNTTYHLRLRAENLGGGESAVAPNFTTATAKPVAVALYNTPESQTEVLLRGGVNPRNSAITDCHLVFGPASGGFEQSAPCSPAHPAINEVQEVDIRAEAGQFRLRFGGQTTHDIPFNAPASLLQSELRALSSIGSPNVGVSGGPAGAAFHNPYLITFEGSLSGQNITEEVTLESGTTPLSLEGGAGEVSVRTQVEGGIYGPAPIAARLTDLQPGVPYHFKIIATSAAGTTESAPAPFVTFAARASEACPNQARRSEQGTIAESLPECRAWELVSPAHKNGGEVLADSANTRASLSGDAAQFTSLQAYAGIAGTGIGAAYMATREASAGTQGWSTHGIIPQVLPTTIKEVGGQTAYQADFSSDLSKGVLTSTTPLTSEPQTAAVQNLYLREGLLTPGADTDHLLTSCPACTEPGGAPLSDPRDSYQPKVRDSTSDLGQIIFEAERNLTVDAPPYPPFPGSFCNENPVAPYLFGCEPRLYESDHGTLRLVGLVPHTVQSLTLSATAGTLTLSFSGEATNPIPFNASASTVQAELDALPSIGGLQPTPGLVSVTGGPGDAAGSTPYLIEFTGSLAGASVPLLSPDLGSLSGAAASATVALDPRSYSCGEGQNTCVGAPQSIAGSGGHGASPNTISSDGSKVFFTVPASGEDSSQSERGNIYMRLNHAQTFQLNRSERSACIAEPASEGCAPGEGASTRYAIASADGSRVFFSSDQQLTDEPCSGEIYVYDTTKPASDPHNLTCVFNDEEPADGTGGSEKLLGTNRDGSYFYFSAGGAIIAGQPHPQKGVAVYVWHNGTIGFIGSTGGDSGDLGQGSVTADPQTARVTPDGRALLFTVGNSTRTDNIGPTGYDQGTDCGSFGGSSCYELYLYRADTDSLICVSCNPSGAPATASAFMQADVKRGGLLPELHQDHPLAEDGNHVFFETAERLVPEDTAGSTDVYEYDALDGTVHLISSGISSDESHFLEATPDGRNVFFTTNQRLLGWDVDESYDLYDARTDGGFPRTPAHPGALHRCFLSLSRSRCPWRTRHSYRDLRRPW